MYVLYPKIAVFYPPAAFEELRQYYQAIQKADQAKVVLVKKDDQAVEVSTAGN